MGYPHDELETSISAVEALEKWPVEMIERMLPRHLQPIGDPVVVLSRCFQGMPVVDVAWGSGWFITFITHIFLDFGVEHFFSISTVKLDFAIVYMALVLQLHTTVAQTPLICCT